MVTALQILFVLFLLILIIILVFRPKRPGPFVMPEHYRELLQDYIPFYARLEEEGKRLFEDQLQRFLSAVRITGAGAEIEDLDRVLIGAAAVIPVHYIRDWEYVNLKEVLVYPGTFNMDFEQYGQDRPISGLVGNGPLQQVMILSKWDLRQGFINRTSNRNTALHEFVHLIDQMDGVLDGVPEILLERKKVPQWKDLLQHTMEAIRYGNSDIDAYGATSPVECFAVVAEYFFEQPEAFRTAHPEWFDLLEPVFTRKKQSGTSK